MKQVPSSAQAHVARLPRIRLERLWSKRGERLQRGANELNHGARQAIAASVNRVYGQCEEYEKFDFPQLLSPHFMASALR